MSTTDRARTADEMLGRDVLIKIHALNIAAGFAATATAAMIARKEEVESEYDGELGRQVLADARLYAAWLEGGVA